MGVIEEYRAANNIDVFGKAVTEHEGGAAL
jgi:hypothetical protein